MSERSTLGHAFGLDLETSFAVPRLPAGRGARGSPRATLELASAGGLRRDWSSADPVMLLRRTYPDGRLVMAVEHDDAAGYSVYAPRYGRHLLSHDGTRIRSAVPRVPAWRWERLLFAQALPLAASLQGRALFHASAVALDGSAIAFSGVSGSGKSSVAAHLVARGARYVTDDVVPLEPTGGAVLAHPGTRLAGVAVQELAAMGAAGRARLGVALGRSEKVYLEIDDPAGPLPLRALYFLVPGARRRRIAIAEAAADPRVLLGSSFIHYLRVPQHLTRTLEACARVGDTVPLFEVHIPTSVPAKDVAGAVEAHWGAL